MNFPRRHSQFKAARLHQPTLPRLTQFIIKLIFHFHKSSEPLLSFFPSHNSIFLSSHSRHDRTCDGNSGKLFYSLDNETDVSHVQWTSYTLDGSTVWLAPAARPAMGLIEEIIRAQREFTSWWCHWEGAGEWKQRNYHSKKFHLLLMRWCGAGVGRCWRRTCFYCFFFRGRRDRKEETMNGYRIIVSPTVGRFSRFPIFESLSQANLMNHDHPTVLITFQYVVVLKAFCIKNFFWLQWSSLTFCVDSDN